MTVCVHLEIVLDYPELYSHFLDNQNFGIILLRITNDLNNI